MKINVLEQQVVKTNLNLKYSKIYQIEMAVLEIGTEHWVSGLRSHVSIVSTLSKLTSKNYANGTW